MGRHWTLDDISWQRFDRSKVDCDILAMVKAAAIVEANSADYVAYLHNVFCDDVEFCDAASRWGKEEAQHGWALGRWAQLADPEFDFAVSLRRFRGGFRIPVDSTFSVRGSRTGELIARCVVECGTSSFYSAIRDATEEPVLKQICRRIAGDEFRHYKLFYQAYRRYRCAWPLSLPRRLAVALGRVTEAGDDELAYAWYCANGSCEPYDRRRHSAAYAVRACNLYRLGDVARALRMILKACNLNPQGRLVDWLARLIWRLLRLRHRRLLRHAA